MTSWAVQTFDPTNKYQEKYLQGIKTEDKTLEEFRKNGRLRTASDELKLDEKLKNSYLLQYAMQNPTEYIKQRNKLLEIAKNKINTIFLETFNQFNGRLPPSDVRDLCLKAAEDNMNMQLEGIEAQLPSDFALQSYKNALQKEVARNFADIGGAKPAI
jgi:hypothetical protein